MGQQSLGGLVGLAPLEQGVSPQNSPVESEPVVRRAGCRGEQSSSSMRAAVDTSGLRSPGTTSAFLRVQWKGCAYEGSLKKFTDKSPLVVPNDFPTAKSISSLTEWAF